jgi:NAD(P)-dependent dehydrogenase (short-subunit alcohol dehydrogenase family)
MSMNLQGKRIAILGAAGTIGSRIALGAHAAGARLLLVDRSRDALAKLGGPLAGSNDVVFCECDITQPASVAGVFHEAVAKLGGLDGAVNSAYPRNARYGRPLLEVTYEDFCENVAMHLGGYFLFMQECLRFSTSRRTAFALVNLSSIYGVMAPRFEVYAGTAMTMPVEYAAIKAGLQHVTRYANAFAKGTGFRANCVSPGGILAGQDPRFVAAYNSHCRSKGMLDADDVVPAVLFLLSDESQFVSGQNIVVDDGFSL